jgi:undecaprenyl-diphosphatase
MFSLTHIINGIILGIVQAISEWLPISSKTQIMLATTFLYHLPLTQSYAIGLFLEAGTVLAAIIYFRKDIYNLIKALVGRGTPEYNKLLRYMVIVTVITGIIGVIIYKFIETSISGYAVGIPMIVLGLLLIVDGILVHSARKRPRTNSGKSIHGMKSIEMAVVGIVQGISAFPGISRSGVTVSSLLFMGFNPEEAFRLSFIVGIPATIGATLVTILFSSVPIATTISNIGYSTIAIAIVASLLLSLFLIDMLLKFAGRNVITKIVLILGIIAILSGIITALTGIG